MRAGQSIATSFPPSISAPASESISESSRPWRGTAGGVRKRHTREAPPQFNAREHARLLLLALYEGEDGTLRPPGEMPAAEVMGHYDELLVHLGWDPLTWHRVGRELRTLGQQPRFYAWYRTPEGKPIRARVYRFFGALPDSVGGHVEGKASRERLSAA
jgi:hypothetical protein